MLTFFVSALILGLITLVFVSLYIWPGEYGNTTAEESASASPASENQPGRDFEIELDGVASGPPNDIELPSDMPHKGWLEAADVNTLSTVLEAEDLTNIKYIGPERAAEIQTYLAEQVPTVE